MRWVHVPYQVVDNKLVMQKTEWPQRCVCCGEDHAGKTYGVGTKIGISSTITYGRVSSETFYPVGFATPYCATCQGHATPTTNVLYVYVIGFFLWVAVGWLLFVNDLAYETIGVVAFLVAAGLIGVGCYLVARFLTNRLSKGRVKATCATHGYAVTVHAAKSRVGILFSSDEYASDFAATNQLEMSVPVAKK